MKKYVMVTGGSGFIGSAVVDELLQTKYNVLVIDRNIKLWTKMLKSNPHLFYIEKNIDEIDVDDISGISIEAIIHLAANHIVSDSVINPLSFYKNNINGLLYLLRLFYPTTYSTTQSRPHFIFSSSAAVYGYRQNVNSNILKDCFYEEDLARPINPYGRSKLWGEQILKDCAIYGLKSIALRYFNVAGSGKNHGYSANKTTHAIPALLNSIKNNNKFSIFGKDYPTKDGTCIRDYLHVKDVARAHVLALERLEKTDLNYDVFNLGSGIGTSMIDLMNVTKETLKLNVNYEFKEKREGDPAVLVANIDKAKTELNWQPRHNLTDIIMDSWSWINRDDWK